jgi:hypothetical protein
MLRFLCFHGFVFFCATTALGENLAVDKNAIRFVGTACKGLSSEQVSFSGNRLVIDLKGMEALTPIHPKASCLIKIPYQGGKSKSTISLDGRYDLGPEDLLALSWRFDTSGALGPAKILSLSETSQGRVSWQDTLSFDTVAASESVKDKDKDKEAAGLLRISLFMDWTSAGTAGRGSQRDSVQPLLLKELTVTSVESVSTSSLP